MAHEKNDIPELEFEALLRRYAGARMAASEFIADILAGADDLQECTNCGKCGKTTEHPTSTIHIEYNSLAKVPGVLVDADVYGPPELAMLALLSTGCKLISDMREDVEASALFKDFIQVMAKHGLVDAHEVTFTESKLPMDDWLN